GRLADTILDRADHRRSGSTSAQDRIGQISRGGLAVGAGDAGEMNPLIRPRVEVPRSRRQRLAPMFHFNPWSRKAFLPMQLTHDRACTGRQRTLRELASVDA